MKTLRAFNGDAKLKADLLDEVRKHREADALLQGFGYGKVTPSGFKGCAVGCTLESYARLSGSSQKDFSRHVDFERFGFPVVLAGLEDKLFEKLPLELSQTWPERFLSATKEGADLTTVWHKFAIWLLTDPEHGVLRHAKTDKVKQAIQRVADLHKNGGTKEEFKNAAYAAYAAAAAADADAADAAYAAAYAADAAAAAADAADAADAAAAYAAADADADAYAAAAADAAAYAAAYADADAAAYAESKKKAYIAQSEKLLKLMAEATC